MVVVLMIGGLMGIRNQLSSQQTQTASPKATAGPEKLCKGQACLGRDPKWLNCSWTYRSDQAVRATNGDQEEIAEVETMTSPNCPGGILISISVPPFPANSSISLDVVGSKAGEVFYQTHEQIALGNGWSYTTTSPSNFDISVGVSTGTSVLSGQVTVMV